VTDRDNRFLRGPWRSAREGQRWGRAGRTTNRTESTPTLLELVPPPSPFVELWYSGLRALPLRVVVPFGDCGDAPGASAHYLGPCLDMSVPNTSSSPSPKASSKTYHQLALRSTTWGIALACQSSTPRRRRRQKSVVKTYHQLGLRPFYPPLLPPLPQLHRSV